MDIGFKYDSVKSGGAIKDWFYDEIIITQPHKIDRKGDVIWIKEMSLDSIDTWNKLWTNRSHIAGWVGLSILIELPWVEKTTGVPSYMPNYQYVDENDVTQTHTWATWAPNYDSIANDKFMIKANSYGDLSASQFVSLEGTISAIVGASMLVHKEYKTNMAPGGDYRPPEV